MVPVVRYGDFIISTAQLRDLSMRWRRIVAQLRSYWNESFDESYRLSFEQARDMSRALTEFLRKRTKVDYIAPSGAMMFPVGEGYYYCPEDHRLYRTDQPVIRCRVYPEQSGLKVDALNGQEHHSRLRAVFNFHAEIIDAYRYNGGYSLHLRDEMFEGYEEVEIPEWDGVVHVSFDRFCFTRPHLTLPHHHHLPSGGPAGD